MGCVPAMAALCFTLNGRNQIISSLAMGMGSEYLVIKPRARGRLLSHATPHSLRNGSFEIDSKTDEHHHTLSQVASINTHHTSPHIHSYNINQYPILSHMVKGVGSSGGGLWLMVPGPRPPEDDKVEAPLPTGVVVYRAGESVQSLTDWEIIKLQNKSENAEEKRARLERLSPGGDLADVAIWMRNNWNKNPQAKIPSFSEYPRKARHLEVLEVPSQKGPDRTSLGNFEDISLLDVNRQYMKFTY
ncbi:hypothetical protein SODALDRAFT_375023 [Sodiomyces alkalinus F11]|uniref:Uncharacterized protein n=1 Tax=Sodiomyces alkalinus (strain CBS 110278 / VKM F-3762 / F11) TaxID=1314773 RepID=A0A3N2Q7U8_SODAK|nr:hypothetical protein SODALDRAFT_375023 [Sodiomyces alkalinus F11]ROT42757.1 hypothetical protein SODALDRAFT_375023 [Sodiomyces alkalinus F11]